MIFCLSVVYLSPFHFSPSLSLSPVLSLLYSNVPIPFDRLLSAAWSLMCPDVCVCFCFLYVYDRTRKACTVIYLCSFVLMCPLMLPSRSIVFCPLMCPDVCCSFFLKSFYVYDLTGKACLFSFPFFSFLLFSSVLSCLHMLSSRSIVFFFLLFFFFFLFFIFFPFFCSARRGKTRWLNPLYTDQPGTRR